jgi:hypothetical protein
MNTKTINLAALEAEEKAQIEAVKKDFETRKLKAYESYKAILKDGVNELAKIYGTLPENWREGELWKALTDVGLVKEMARPTGVSRKNGDGAKLTKRAKVSDADLLAFLETVRSTPEIAKHFSLSNPSQRLNGLLKAGKITMEDEGNKKTWKKAPVQNP